MFKIRVMFFRNLFFLLILLNLSSVSAQTMKECISLFEASGMSFDSSEIKKKSRYTQAEKAYILESFKQALNNRDKSSMRELALNYPFLKTLRRALPVSIAEASLDKGWFDVELGWTPLQMAVYYKDLNLLNFLLNLGFEYRAKKDKKRSLEYNPLHLAIEKNFPEGAKSILKQSGFQKFGKYKGRRFIDEKTSYKKTPWALAVLQDIKNKKIKFIPIIGKYQPSGYVESFFYDGPKDGFVIAKEFGIPVIQKLAKKYLVAPEYDKYQEIKKNAIKKNRTKKPSYY